MGLNPSYIEGQTPLDEEAIEWTLKHKFGPDRILTEEFLLLVHKKMFSDVWKWAR